MSPTIRDISYSKIFLEDPPNFIKSPILVGLAFTIFLGGVRVCLLTKLPDNVSVHTFFCYFHQRSLPFRRLSHYTLRNFRSYFWTCFLLLLHLCPYSSLRTFGVFLWLHSPESYGFTPLYSPFSLLAIFDTCTEVAVKPLKSLR